MRGKNRDVRKHHTLVEICKKPEIAAEVTITAAEKLGVDAAIIFADLLLPLEPMGLPFEFLAGEGPVVHHPVRTAEDVRALRTDRADELGVCGAGDPEGGVALQATGWGLSGSAGRRTRWPAT